MSRKTKQEVKLLGTRRALADTLELMAGLSLVVRADGMVEVRVWDADAADICRSVIDLDAAWVIAMATLDLVLACQEVIPAPVAPRPSASSE